MPHADYIGSDGERWPSATELTRLLPDDWKWGWYHREVKKYGWRGWQKCHATSKRAMRLGTHTHGLVEMALTGRSYVAWLDDKQTIPEPERRLKLVRAWAKALVEATSRHAVKEVEVKVVDKLHKEHGTVDCLAFDDESGVLFPKDWKTSGQMGIDYPIQLAIYNRCLSHMSWQEAIGNIGDIGEIERVDKELKSQKALASGEHHVQIKRFDNLSQYYSVVDALHVIWDYCNKQGAFKPKEKISEGV